MKTIVVCETAFYCDVTCLLHEEGAKEPMNYK